MYMPENAAVRHEPDELRDQSDHGDCRFGLVWPRHRTKPAGRQVGNAA
jgi:hypothetical protein